MYVNKLLRFAYDLGAPLWHNTDVVFNLKWDAGQMNKFILIVLSFVSVVAVADGFDCDVVVCGGSSAAVGWQHAMCSWRGRARAALRRVSRRRGAPCA